MSLANVVLLDVYSSQPRCSSTLVGYDDRRIFVNEECGGDIVGRVVRVQYSDEELADPLRVHPVFEKTLDIFRDDLADSLMTIEEVAEISDMTFFMLTGGVGIKVENSVPSVVPLRTQSDDVVSLSLLDTREGIVPHTLMIPKGASVEISQVLFDVLSKQSPCVERDDAESIGALRDEDLGDICLYRLLVPRVIPVD